jgi:hypothetical protein
METAPKPAIAVAFAVLLALAAPVRADDCGAQSSAPWTQAGNAFSAAAAAKGPRCEKAKIALVLHAPGGKALFTYHGTADTILSLNGVKTKAQMKQALAKWIADAMRKMTTSDQLPDWNDQQDQPTAGEFPFFVEDGIKRPAYLAIRKAKRPMFCFVQGMESIGCAVLGTDGAVTKIGAQSFPG